MARKATIQILRGSNNSSDNTTILADGELFYDKGTGLLYVGDGSSTLRTLYNARRCLVSLWNLQGDYPTSFVGFGKDANCDISGNGIAIGYNAETKNDGIAIGYNAKIAQSQPNMEGATQIGAGINSVANSLKFQEKTIVDGSGKINADTALLANEALEADFAYKTSISDGHYSDISAWETPSASSVLTFSSPYIPYDATTHYCYCFKVFIKEKVGANLISTTTLMFPPTRLEPISTSTYEKILLPTIQYRHSSIGTMLFQVQAIPDSNIPNAWFIALFSHYDSSNPGGVDSYNQMIDGVPNDPANVGDMTFGIQYKTMQ